MKKKSRETLLQQIQKQIHSLLFARICNYSGLYEAGAAGDRRNGLRLESNFFSLLRTLNFAEASLSL
jgi:hypothetical protein